MSQVADALVEARAAAARQSWRTSYRAYVARVGRAIQIELYFIVPKDQPARALDEWDRLRDEIGVGLDVRVATFAQIPVHEVLAFTGGTESSCVQRAQ